MAVSALIVTLDEDRDGAALRALADDGRFTIGPREGDRVAVVLDTPGPDADDAAFDWLRGQPGVAFVDVIAVYLDPLAAASETP
jgi:hypothetical protein